MRSIRIGAIAAAIVVLSGCASGGGSRSDVSGRPDDLSDIPRVAPPGAINDPKHDNLNAVLWSQTAAENRALARQAFNQAARTLAAAKADPAFSALPASEQGQIGAGAPLAIITDIDETVLDSSAFNADLIRDPVDNDLPPAEAHKRFDQRWNDWVAQREALPIPGAVEFLTQAEKDGVTVFYITNRKDPEKAETCNNLIQAKLPLKDCATQVLTRNDQDGRPKEKGSRRKTVGAKYRVVLVMGDNLGDFSDGIYSTLEARAGIVDDRSAWWGERWIILPNPMYGSWEEVISNIDNDAVSPIYGVELERRRLQKARTMRGVDWWAQPSAMEKSK
jgi:5'-nucleotidase (lipoprotein e(P4) family)